MKQNFREFSPEHSCPCGSSASYGDCCAKKDFRFGLDDSGNLIQQAPLSDELRDELARAAEMTERLYGRPPGDEDLVFSFAMDGTDSSGLPVTRALVAAGMHSRAYAFHYSGILPVEGNEGLFSDADLDEFSDLCAEYDELIESGLRGSEISAVCFTRHLNDMISSQASSLGDEILMVIADFNNRHARSADFLDFVMESPLDYALFSLHKTRKAVRTVRALAAVAEPEAIYAMGRGTFENFLYLQAMVQEPLFFAEKILPRVDRESFDFARYPDGRINYNKVICRETGDQLPLKITVAGLNEKYGTATDKRLYDLFYRTACTYVHVDVMSAKTYFREVDPFDEVDPALVAQLISLALALRVIGRVLRLQGVEESFRRDGEFFVTRVARSLAEIFQILGADADSTPEVFRAFELWVSADGCDADI